ncbi:MAG TPA: phosphodiesterase [Candidatus Margulisbacteria bacterium]|nr:MAG: hypothetical protein A2X41_03980 [Candidatus Margulisbacteria bacterium GWE2_39_32]HCT85846.1 phosphodiesterase [Candidatus Margulisiibacteriota bacterium]
MKLGIISDTHGDYSAWEYIRNYIFLDVDAIIHAGDILYGADYANMKSFTSSLTTTTIPIYAARGNCDKYMAQEIPDGMMSHPYGTVTFDKKRIVFTHGDIYLSYISKKLLAKELRADILISGHTHIYNYLKEDGIYFINPGSPASPKNNEKTPTVMILENTKLHLINSTSGSIIQTYNID